MGKERAMEAWIVKPPNMNDIYYLYHLPSMLPESSETMIVLCTEIRPTVGGQPARYGVANLKPVTNFLLILHFRGLTIPNATSTFTEPPALDSSVYLHAYQALRAPALEALAFKWHRSWQKFAQAPSVTQADGVFVDMGSSFLLH
ncbi:MAG: hypothetical protein Q9188_001068 [Gyalolechia gomerana]